jgi:uncharacterized protein (TIGR03435 family)
MTMFKPRTIAHAAFALLASTAFTARASAQEAKPTEPTPAYEVATIKPWDGNGYGMPLRVYIQSAFGLPVNSTGWVIGPEWVNSTRYVIKSKPPDSIRDAMKTMTTEQQRKTYQQMEQSLLADRFQLKAHFETRDMPVYELVPAKGGPKLKENPDKSKGQAAVGSHAIRATAAPIRMFTDLLESVPDIGGRVIIDKTGLAGNYDISLKWASIETPSTSGGESAATPDAESASLFTAIEEQLGLRLVPAREPGQVLVIDHIERPSEN